MLIFIALWHLLVYCPVAHSTWMTGGFLHEVRPIEFKTSREANLVPV